MDKYLIFGATGAIGSNLAQQLKNSNKNIHLIGRNHEKLEEMSSNLKCDYTVINLSLIHI